MLEKLKNAEKRFIEIEAALALPETVSDGELFRSLMKECASLAPVIEEYRRYERIEKDIEENRLLLDASEGDAEMRDLIEEELDSLREQSEQSMNALRRMLIASDPNDDKNVIIEIRSGAGGDEAALFAAVLYRMYCMYAEQIGFKVEPITKNETDLGGFREVTFTVAGHGAYSRLRYESGVHRVQRVPETETQGRIHTSTVTVAVLPEIDDVEIEINPADIKIESCKSSGAGGQHVNKTESAVRLTHMPSGIVIECREERSQFQNRDKAMKLLRTRLYDMKKTEQDQKIASERRSQVGTGDRSERIRTYNYPQGRVTDHRIGMTLYSLERFLSGDIGSMLEALMNADVAEKLKGDSL